MRNTLLLADNDEKFLETWRSILVRAGYDVRPASNPAESRRVLQDCQVDLAVLDMRLVDDNDAMDLSGLEIACDPAYRRVPKVVLTAFPVSYERLRQALGSAVDDLPPAVAFVDKAEGPGALLEVVRETLERWPRLRFSAARVSEQVNSDNRAVRIQAALNYAIAIVVSIMGFCTIFAGILLAWLDKVTIGVVGTACGLVIEVLGFLFFTRLDLANSRMDRYHVELLQTHWLELVLAACEQLPSERQAACTERAISAATDSWFALHSVRDNAHAESRSST